MTIEAKRLILREYTEDFDAMHEIFSDEETMQQGRHETGHFCIRPMTPFIPTRNISM